MTELNVLLNDYGVDPELTFEIRGAIFATRNELGTGWSEEIYHKGLILELQSRGLHVASKPRRTLAHRNVDIHTFEPDILVNDEVILELKVLAYKKQFIGVHYFQLLNYLKFFGKPLGMLVDFAPTRIQIKRVRLDKLPYGISEDFSAFQNKVYREDRNQLWDIVQCIKDIAEQYGVGYSEVIYKHILQLELEHRGLSCVYPFDVPVLWKGEQIGEDKVQLLLVNEAYLVHVKSLLHHPTTEDFTCVKTYLNCLDLKFGLVVNFGRKEIQINAVDSD